MTVFLSSLIMICLNSYQVKNVNENAILRSLMLGTVFFFWRMLYLKSHWVFLLQFFISSKFFRRCIKLAIQNCSSVLDRQDNLYAFFLPPICSIFVKHFISLNNKKLMSHVSWVGIGSWKFIVEHGCVSFPDNQDPNVNQCFALIDWIFLRIVHVCLAGSLITYNVPIVRE